MPWGEEGWGGGCQGQARAGPWVYPVRTLVCRKPKVVVFVVAITSLTQLWSLKGLPLH